MTFNGETTIGDSSDPGSGNVSGTGSTLTFNGTTTINNTVSGTNSTLTFGGNTAIGNGISGSNGTHFVRSEEHTSELPSLMRISYAVVCLKKKNKHKQTTK